jgi:RimK family alpha-L-glutamate ligase
MKIAILGFRGGWHEARLVEALEARGAATTVASITRLVGRIGGIPELSAQDSALDGCAAVVVRAIPAGSLEQVIFRVDALHRLHDLAIAVVNSARTIERSVDKYLTSCLLREAELPTPRTIVCERFEDAMAAFEELGGDVVVKPLFGAEGRGMTRIADRDVAYRTFRALELVRSVYYLQQYVPHGSRDVRAFVVGDRVVAAMVRHGESWKSNVAQGAVVEPIELSPELEHLALRAARVLEADYAGVDLLPHDDGEWFVLELNGIPGWQGLQRTTGLDVAGAVADLVLTRARQQPDIPDRR